MEFYKYLSLKNAEVTQNMQEISTGDKLIAKKVL